MSGDAKAKGHRKQEQADSTMTLDMLDLDLTMLDMHQPSDVEVKVEQREDQSAVKSEPGTSTTPILRKRSVSGCFAQPVAKAQRQSDNKFQVEHGQTNQSPHMQQEAANESKTCLGCARTCNETPDLFVQDETISWAFSGSRGAWCRDCHTVWRTIYSKNHGLSFFPAWLADWNNKTNFNEYLLSYLTYVKEGSTKVTSAMLETRVQTLQWLFLFKNANLNCDAVIPLEDALAPGSQYKEFARDPSNLTTIISQEGQQVAVFINSGLTRKSKGAFARPLAKDAVIALQSRPFLASDKQHDCTLLSELFGEFGGEGASAGSIIVKTEDDDGAFHTKAGKRLSALVTISKTLLSKYSCDGWEKVPESGFTKITSQAATLYVECGQVGEAAEVTELANTYSVGLTAAKSFVRVFRDYTKSHHKTSRLCDLALPLRPFIAFLESVNISVTSTLRRLLLKVNFYESTKTFAKLSTALDRIVEDGLALLFSKEELDSSVADVWVSAMVIDVMVSYTGSIGCTDMKESLKTLHEDMNNAHCVLSEIKSLGFKQSMEELAADVGAFAHLVGVYGSDVVINEVEKSGIRLNNKRMAPVKKALQSCEAGQEVLSEVALLMQTSGQDDIADSKFQAAWDLLGDERLVSLLNDGGEVIHVTNLASLEDGTVVNVLNEVLLNLEEAASLWSAFRYNNKVENIIDFLNAVENFMSMCDEILLFHAFAIVKASHPACTLLDDDVEDPADWNHDVLSQEFKEMGSMIEQHWAQEIELVNLKKRMLHFIESSPACLKNSCPEEWSASDSGRYIENGNIRDLMYSILTKLCAFMGRPSIDTKDVVEEFSKQVKAGDIHTTRLMQAAQMKTDLAELMKCDMKIEILNSTISMKVDFGEGVKHTELNDKELIKFVTSLPTKTCVSLVTSTVKNSIRFLLASLVECPDLSSLAIPARIDETTSISEILDAFVPPKIQVAASGVAAEEFKKDSTNTSWSVEYTKSLVIEILNSFPEDGEVDVGSLCKAAHVESNVSMKEVGALIGILDMYAVISKVVAVFSWIRTEFFGKKRLKIIEGETANGLLQMAIGHLIRATKTAAALTESGVESTVAPLSGMPWVWPVDKFEGWAKLVGKAQTALQRHILSLCVDAAGEKAMQVIQATPHYEHLNVSSKLNLAAANKLLVQWPSRGALNDGFRSLFKCLQDMSRLHCSWEFAVSLKDDAQWGEQVMTANTAFQNAKSALATIAAINIIANVRGKPQVEAAEKLLAKKENIPRIVLTSLEKLL